MRRYPDSIRPCCRTAEILRQGSAWQLHFCPDAQQLCWRSARRASTRRSGVPAYNTTASSSSSDKPQQTPPSKPLQNLPRQPPLRRLPQRLVINPLHPPPHRKRSPHIPPLNMQHPIPPNRNLKPDLRPQHLQQHHPPLRRKQSPRHTQTNLKHHSALQRAQPFPLARRWVNAG